MTEPKLLRERETIWRCPFCQRSWRAHRRPEANAHLVGCLERPDRHPWAGELTSARQAGRLFLVEPKVSGDVVTKPYRSGDIPADAWLEWVPREMPVWWPGPGKMWDGLGWRDIPGWSRRFGEGVFGVVGEAPPEDVWPEVDGVPLDKLERGERLLALLRGQVR